MGGWGDCLPENVRSIIELGGPLGLAAMAFSVVGGHVCCAGVMVVEMELID